MRKKFSFAIFVCLLFAGARPAFAQSSVTLAWDASPEADVSGYVLSWGTRLGEFTSSLDVGNVTQWTVPGLEAGQQYYFTVQAYNAMREFSAPAAAVSNEAIIIRTGANPVDDRPDVFWQNVSTGELLTWHLDGSAVVDTRSLSIPAVPDTEWRVVGTGDLNGDGSSDLLWRHATGGWLAAWYLRDEQVTYTGYLSINRISDPNWRIAGVGDIDGDRHADILWQHSDGRLASWLLRGTEVLSTRFLSIPRMHDPKWRIAAVGDLDADGMADLVWQSTDGWLATWLLEGTTVKSTQYFSINRMTDSNWRIVGSVGADRHNRPALIWRHTDGRVALWFVRGSAVVSTVRTTPGRVSDMDWVIVGGR